MRLRHYSRRTEQAYVAWIRRYIVFHQKKHPSAMGATEIVAFLSWLAVDRRVSASTQNQALSALVFLYGQVLGLDIGPIERVPRARMPDKLPVVLSREEIGRLITHVDGTMWLVVALLYGTPFRTHRSEVDLGAWPGWPRAGPCGPLQYVLGRRTPKRQDRRLDDALRTEPLGLQHFYQWCGNEETGLSRLHFRNR